MSEWYWTWSGECFGYREGDRLFAYHGLQVGQFDGDEVYGADGRYLGEVMSGNHNRGAHLTSRHEAGGWRTAETCTLNCRVVIQWPAASEMDFTSAWNLSSIANGSVMG